MDNDRPVGPEQHQQAARRFLVEGETDRFGRPMLANAADLCALTPDNDPFHCGRPRDWKWAEWFAALWNEHGPAEGVRHHLSRFHYRLFTQDPVLPDGAIYTAGRGFT